MSPLPEDLDILAAEFVMGTAEGAELQRAEALMLRDTDFQAAVQRWRTRFNALDETATPLTPSEGLWETIASHIALAQPGAEAPARAALAKPPGFFARLWDSASFWRYSGLMATCAALVLAVALTAILQRPSPSPVYVAVLNTSDGRAAAVVNAFADGTVELVPLERIAVPEGRIIEVWTLQNRTQGPVSIGRMDQTRRLTLNLRDLERPDANHLFELTLEPPGGSPTGKPTGPVLMKGLTAKAI